MFGDIGWAELVLIGIVALIVIGPEDLPDMFRQVGRFTAKIRQMSREFSRAMEQAAKESGVKDMADDLKSATSAKSLGLNKVKEAADRFEKWDPIKNAAKPTVATKPVASTVVSTALPVAETAVAVSETAVTETAVAEPKIMGPETQALIDKQAAKKAILADTAEKLKAVEAATVSPAADVAPVVKAKAGKPAVAAETAPETKPETKPASKPRAPRKTKKADEA